MTWNVNDALEELVDAIQKGSPLLIEPRTRYSYKEKFRTDFERNHKAYMDPETPEIELPRYDWDIEKPYVATLAYVTGSLATTLTMRNVAWEAYPRPGAVDPESAFLAAYLVSYTCPPPGHWCMQYQIDYREEKEPLPGPTSEERHFLRVLKGSICRLAELEHTPTGEEG